jgi:predicted DNA-binding protein (MmcQ/YjbR family)
LILEPKGGKFMIYKNDLMRIFQPDHEKMLSFGFSFQNDVYTLKKFINDNKFYFEVKVTESIFSIDVIDNAFGDPYELFSIGTAAGDFISVLHHESEILIDEIIDNCFSKVKVREKILEYVTETFDARIDYPFSQLPTSAVFKVNENEKWFGVILEVALDLIGGETSDVVEVVNLKLDPKLIEELIDFKTYFPAYHMNKTHWVSIALSKGADWTLLFDLIRQSYKLVAR